MAQRFLRHAGAPLVLTALGAAVAVGLVVRAQTPPAGDAAGPAPRTAWGTPDLTGIWTNSYDVPLQRPSQYKDKEFFTEEERQELDKRRGEIVSQDVRRHGRGSAQDVGGAYSTNIFLSHKPTGKRTSLITDPPDGRIPPYTPEAQKRRETIRAFVLELLQATDTCKQKLVGCVGGKYGPPSPKYHDVPPFYIATGSAGGGLINRSDHPEDRTLGERCMGAILPDFGGATGFYPQFVLAKDALSIYYDTGQGQGWQRIIPITDRPHLPAHVRLWWGDSRAKWEGDTLVVDVTNFSPKTDYQGARENLHLVERYTRKDANTIEVVVRIEDPTTWTKPWTVTQELSRQPDKANRHYKEPRCHEGNHGMPALLAGARAEERAHARGKGPHPAALCSAGCGGFSGGFADDGEEANPFNR